MARIRQHRNPLNFRDEVEIPRWEDVFADPSLPLEADLGCGHGDFVCAWAAVRPDLNVVGLEIREEMAERVQRKVARHELSNAAIIYCNANFSFSELFAPESLRTVYVSFPDPWFKKKHHKRRIVTPALVEQIRAALVPEGELRFMTDYEQYAREVVAQMRTEGGYTNPHGVGRPAPREPDRPPTHREEWHMSQGHPVHRYVWRRTG